MHQYNFDNEIKFISNYLLYLEQKTKRISSRPSLFKAGVGRALVASGVPRNEIFLATKVWTDCIGLGPRAVMSSIAKSMELLQVGYCILSLLHVLSVRLSASQSLRIHQVDYLDLVYVHWPVSTPPEFNIEPRASNLAPEAAAHVHAYKTLEQLVKEGKVMLFFLDFYTLVVFPL